MFEEINIKLKPSSDYFTRTVETDAIGNLPKTIEFQLHGLEMGIPNEFSDCECYLQNYKYNNYYLVCKKKIDSTIE